MIPVQICGITTTDDALMAVAAGADALGFVFHSLSPRNIAPEAAAAIIRELPPFVQTVGLFVNMPYKHVNDTVQAAKLDMVQLHGDETPEYCTRIRHRIIKAFRVKDIDSLDPIRHFQVAGFLLDAWSPIAHGGTGMTFNWDIAKVAEQYGPVILAGGLTPENVAQAVETVSPFAVDVSSGVESAPGRKDPEKVREFIRRAKG